MPNGTPQALGRRTALLMLLAATLMYATCSASAAHAQTPPVEGTIRLTPALSNVLAAGGPFTVYIVAENIQHIGTITYDDDRDGTPDRSEPSNGMAAFEVTIAYDPAVLAVGGVERGPDLEQTGRSFQCLPPDQKPGSLTFGCISTGTGAAGAQGTMTLAAVELLPQAPGLSILSLDAAVAGPLGDSVAVAISGGAARVSGTLQATATGIAPTGTGGATPQPNETLAPTSSETPLTATASPVTTGLPGGSPTPTVTDDPGGGFGGVALWVVIAGGSIGTGLLGLAALLWRERSQRGT